MISFKQLRYALAVEKNLHFRKAAEECAVSQSAMSSALIELERQLGFSLFERDNKRVLVTPIGKSALATARQIKLHMEKLHRFSASSHEALTYPMSIGIIPTACPFLLPKLLPSVHKDYPKCELDIVEAETEDLLNRVRSGQIDTAIVALPYPTDGLLQFEFYSDSLYWVIHKTHPKSKALSGKKYVSGSDISNHELMLLNKDNCLYKHTDQALSLHINHASSRKVTNLSTLLQLVISGTGTTILPKIAVAQMINASMPIHAIELKDSNRALAFVVRPNYASLQNIEALKEILQVQLKDR